MGLTCHTFTLKVRSLEEALARGSNNSPLPMKMNNGEVKSLINIYDVLYKLSRVAGTAIYYHTTDLKCDILRNWLIRGQFQWSIATPARLNHHLLASALALGQERPWEPGTSRSSGDPRGSKLGLSENDHHHSWVLIMFFIFSLCFLDIFGLGASLSLV